MSAVLKRYLQIQPNANTNILEKHINKSGKFTAMDMKNIYKYPSPNPDNTNVISVVSFGGSLYGTQVKYTKSTYLSNTNGDVYTYKLIDGDTHTYWASIGIDAKDMPTILIVNLTNDKPEPDNGTDENTLDVQTIGACCASGKTIIILYIYPNSLNSFYTCVETAIKNPILVNGVVLRSSVISISWGTAEINFSNVLLNNINNLFKSAVDQGINIFCASGDNGSTDGINDGKQHLDFPSSSPYVTSCGGTTLRASNNNITSETVWKGCGGGYSNVFSKPIYQKNINTTNMRASPDLVQNADPNTGCQFLLNNVETVYGGTSMVSPALAGYIASIKLNKFLNPIIYNLPVNLYNDITKGNNGNYIAKIGYDVASGLGSVKGNILTSELIKNIDTKINKVTDILLDKSSDVINIGYPTQYSATIVPWTAWNQSVIWSSNNPNIATVHDGIVTGKVIGNVIITAQTVDGKFTKQINITVGNNIITRLIIPQNLYIINVNQNLIINNIVLPYTDNNNIMAWSSSDNNIVQVINGNITGIKPGNATITVTYTLDNKIKAQANVTVKDIPITNISIGHLLVGGTLQLVNSVLPTNNTNNINWSSSNIKIATIDANGIVTGVSKGSSIITCSSGNIRSTLIINIL